MDTWAGGGADTVQGLNPTKWTNLIPPCGGLSDSKDPPISEA